MKTEFGFCQTTSTIYPCFEVCKAQTANIFDIEAKIFGHNLGNMGDRTRRLMGKIRRKA